MAPEQTADQLIRYAEDFADDCVKAGYVTTSAASHQKLRVKLAAALSQAEADRVDAERYRWLRDKAAAYVVRPFADRPGFEWDPAIDTARKASPSA